MNKKVVSKVGKRHKPEIDMMEFIQVDDIMEFDLDRDLFDDKPIKKKSPAIYKSDDAENEQIAKFSEEIENQE